jgi:hypothetical protein
MDIGARRLRGSGRFTAPSGLMKYGVRRLAAAFPAGSSLPTGRSKLRP